LYVVHANILATAAHSTLKASERLDGYWRLMGRKFFSPWATKLCKWCNRADYVNSCILTGSEKKWTTFSFCVM
jgi:hypothetical protein